MAGFLDYIPAILGGISTFAGANNQKQAGAGAAAGATYNPTNVTTPFGATNYSVGANGRPTYTTTQGVYGPLLPQLGNLAGAGYGAAPGQLTSTNAALNNLSQYANTTAGNINNLASSATPGVTGYLNGTSPLATNANSLVNSSGSFLSKTDPAAIYQMLTNLAKPGDTSATQSMFDRLQGTGRLGLNQNGQLGDIGGLALAQQTADNQRRLQSEDFAQQNAIAGGNLGLADMQQGNSNASMLTNLLNAALAAKGTGAAAQQSALTNDTTAGAAGLEGLLGINAASSLPLQQSIQASSGMANAGANAGQLSMLGAKGPTDALGGIGQGLLSTVPGSLGSQLSQWLNPTAAAPTGTIAPGAQATISQAANATIPGAATTGLQAAGASALGDAGASTLAGLGSFGGAPGVAGTTGSLGALGGTASGLGQVGLGGATAAPAAVAPTVSSIGATGAASGAGAGLGATGAGLGGLAAYTTPAAVSQAIGASIPELGATAAPAAGGLGASIANLAGPAAIAGVGAYDLYHLFTDPQPMTNDRSLAQLAYKGSFPWTKGSVGRGGGGKNDGGPPGKLPEIAPYMASIKQYPYAYTDPGWAQHYPTTFKLVNGKSVLR